MLGHEPLLHTPEHKLWELLFTNFSTDQSEYEFDQLMILCIQNFLRQHKVPYLLTYSFHYKSMFDEQVKYVPKYILDQRLGPRFILNDSFSMYTDRNKLPRGPHHHPLVEGHKGWSNYLLDYIQQNNLLANHDL